MLVFSEKVEAVITVNNNIQIKIIKIGKSRVKIGIEAPKEIPIRRNHPTDLTATDSCGITILPS